MELWSPLCLLLLQYIVKLQRPCPPTDSIITLMTVWRITGRLIIRTTIMLITYSRV